MAEGRQQRKHIFYADETTSICSDRVMVPDNPVRFPPYEGEACPSCYARMQVWITWWLEQGYPYVKKEN